MSGEAPAAPGLVWSEAAQALFALDRHTAVSAGAGTGKTTALVELLLRLVGGDTPAGPCEPDQVVAITFTERAGAELSGRLASALAEGIRKAEEGGDAVRADRLAAALRRLPGMAVGTIHGFAARLLREHALEAGVDPDFDVLEAEGAEELLADAARGAALGALDVGDPMVQALAAGHGGVAGLASLAAGLLRERATRGLTGPTEGAAGDPAAVEAARAELAAAARDLVQLGAQAATPSGCKAVAALEASLLALPPAAAPSMADAARRAALADALKGWRPGKSEPPQLRAARERLRAAADALPARTAELLAAPQAGALAALVDQAGRRYAAAKQAVRALDFDDLLVRARDLLRDAPAVRRALRERTRVLLVDEYQDVNGLQAEILEYLAATGSRTVGGGGVGDDPLGGEGAPPLLVAVGDAKQSIYRFRGADVGVFAALLERLGAGRGGRVLHLRENHRSTAPVIELVNDVLSRSAGTLGVPFGDEDRLRAVRDGGARPGAELLEDEGERSAEERRGREARALARRIQEMVSGDAGVAWAERGPDGVARSRPPRFGDVAILFRRLTQVAGYERALRDAGIPFRLARGGGFYRAPEVRDLGELCASLADPGDEIAWAALLRSPLCGISDGSLLLLAPAGLARLARVEPSQLVASLNRAWRGQGPPDEGARLLRFLETWQRLLPLRHRLDVADLAARAADELDLEAALLASPDGERRARNLRKVLDLARRAAARGDGAGALAARLRRLARLPQREPEADLESEDAVALLSVHQAKGLEWPVVVIPDLAGRPPPARVRALLDEAGRVCVGFFDLAAEEHHATASLRRVREGSGRADSAESRRLLYVALTRARDHLVLSGAGDGGSAGSWAEVVRESSADLLRRLPADGVLADGVPADGVPADGAPAESVARSPISQGGLGDAGATAEPGGAGGDPGVAAPASPLRLRPPPPEPAQRVPVTALAEYARCPRRHWFGRHMALPEPRGLRGDDDADRATERGTLAHALLSEVDLLEPPRQRRALLAASATRRGRDPASPGVRRILRDVERFLEADEGQRLTAWERSGVLRREVPFLLRLGGEGGGVCYLDGAIDVLAEEGGELWVVDFKYAVLRPGAADRHRLQLLAYALAAGRAIPGRRVRAELWFLRGGGVVEVTPSTAELARFEADAPRLAREAARAERRDATPAALGRDEARCRAEGCGWVGRCHAAREPARPRSGPAGPAPAGPPPGPPA